jgi:hypothetical protein
MKIHWTILFQLVALFVQMVLSDIPGITPEWVTFFHRIVAFLQAAQGIIAGYSQPPAKKEA